MIIGKEMTSSSDKLRNLLAWATEIQAIAQNGLTYSTDLYDKERYEQLAKLSVEMMSAVVDEKKEVLQATFLKQAGYATPKIDVRALIIQNDELLLVREAQDGKWALPGGWADVNYSPSECIVKEVHEETGLQTRVKRLLALWDTAKHDHPPHWPYIYKCIFYCEVIGGQFTHSHEILDVGFFSLGTLPPLSECRITRSQLEKLMNLYDSNDFCTVYD